MIKPDEEMFFFMCKGLCGQQQPDRTLVKDLILTPGFPIHPKRAMMMLEKWTDRGWWEYGVSLWTGWMTDKAYFYAIIGGEIVRIND